MSKTLFTASTTWQGPMDTEPVVYFGGITQNLNDNIILVDSYDSDYPAGTAFKLIGNSKNDLGRLYKPFSKDNIVLTNVPEDINYKIDDEKNLLIFPSTFLLSSSEISNIKCKYYENFASIFKSNLVTFEKVIDFRLLKERSISAMLSTDDGIFIACTCGSLWFYDGFVLKGPIFKIEDDGDLPASSLIKHKFPHEDEEYIYIASDEKPRLYRSKISNAKNGIEWEIVYNQGQLAASTGGILSMTSALNKIFLGCRNNKVLIYSRDNEIVLSESTDFLSDSLIETNIPVETLTEVNLKSDNLNDFEPIVSDIKCIESTRNQVFLGLSNKSEIWSYSELLLDNPELQENWAHFKFDEIFKNDPAPAQYYSYNSNTFSRNDSNLGIARYYDDNSRSYIKEALILKGNTLSSTGVTVDGMRLFEFSNGSDWEQAQLINLPDQDFIMIQCASTQEITNLSNITIIDGYELKNYDYVLLKNQPTEITTEIANGIYQFLNGTLSKNENFIINENSILLGFYIQNGSINKNHRYFCTVSSYNSENPIFNKSKYTFEIELRNLVNSSATASSNFKTAGVLNSILDNEERILSSTGYTGYQGFEIADSYGVIKLQMNHEILKLESGNKIIEKELPVFGNYKNWIFSSGSSLAATTDNWKINNFVSSLIGTTEAVTDSFSNTYNRYMLRLTPSLRGNPAIEINNLNLELDPDATLNLRVRISPQNSYGFNESYLKAYWADSSYDYVQSSAKLIETSDDFKEYILKPAWKNKIDNLKIEFVNLPESTSRPTYIDIDYIKIINEKILFDLNNSFSKVRITVEDKDIKVWLGKQSYPFINAKNFISLENYNNKYLNPDIVENNYNKQFIRFGKIDSNSGNSLFAYSGMSFYVGEAYSPISKKIFNFKNMQKLSSTGGIRFFAFHDGTIYCATDGFDSNNVNVSPDDRQSKIFAYDVNSNSWSKKDLTFERKQLFNDDGTYNLLGIVRPLNLISYKGLLYMSGQYANIKVV